MDDDDDAGGPQSLFVVVSYEPMAPFFISILRLQLDTPKHQQRIQVTENDYVTRIQVTEKDYVSRIQVTENDYVTSFSKPKGFRRPRLIWSFSPPTSSTGYNMYMVPEYDSPDVKCLVRKPLHATKFNFSTGACLQIKPPIAPKFYGRVVNWEGLTFFMAHPDWYYDTPDPVFEFYDPGENKWTALQNFPNRYDVYPNCLTIVATALLDDTILYNIGRCEFWAYNVAKDKWYTVHVEDKLCYSIFGQTVVIENTIYALTSGYPSPVLVLALSVEREETKDDLVYSCSLRSQISVPGLEDFEYDDVNRARSNRRHLVHLGGDNFCVVQSCQFSGLSDRIQQPIKLTRIKLSGKNSMIVTDIILYELEVLDGQQFEVGLCFSLPDCKTTALEGCKGFTISLDPESEPVQAPTRGDGAAPERRITHEEGRSIYLRSVPLNASLGEITEKLKKFGPIKRFRISKNEEGNCCSGSVEYKRATSKRCAIKASPIVIGGCQVELNEKKTSLIDVSKQ